MKAFKPSPYQPSIFLRPAGELRGLHYEIRHHGKRNPDLIYKFTLRRIFDEEVEIPPNKFTVTSSASELSDVEEIFSEPKCKRLVKRKHQCQYFKCRKTYCKYCFNAHICDLCPLCDSGTQWRGPCLKCYDYNVHPLGFHTGYPCDYHRRFLKTPGTAGKFRTHSPSEVSLFKFSRVLNRLPIFYKDSSSSSDSSSSEGTDCCDPLIFDYWTKEGPQKIVCKKSRRHGMCIKNVGISQLKKLQRTHEAFTVMSSRHDKGCLDPLCCARTDNFDRKIRLFIPKIIKRGVTGRRIFSNQKYIIHFVTLDKAMFPPPNSVEEIDENLEERNLRDCLAKREDDCVEYEVTIAECLEAYERQIKIKHNKDEIYPWNLAIPIDEPDLGIPIFRPRMANRLQFVTVFTHYDSSVKTHPIVETFLTDWGYEHNFVSTETLAMGETLYPVDVDIQGRYDDIFWYYDRNTPFYAKRMKAHTSTGLIHMVSHMPIVLQFQALYNICANAKDSTTVAKAISFPIFFAQLIILKEETEYDSIRRYAYFILSVATETRRGKCAFYELGPEVLTELYAQYLTEEKPIFRRLCMRIISNICQDGTMNAIAPNFIDYAHTFSSLCTDDDDLKLSILQLLITAFADSDVQDWLRQIDEYRLAPVIMGCFSKNKRVLINTLKLIDNMMDATIGENIIEDTLHEEDGMVIVHELINRPMLIRTHPFTTAMWANITHSTNMIKDIRKFGALDKLLKFLGRIFDADMIIGTLKVLVKVAMDKNARHIVSHNNMLPRVSPYINHGHSKLSQVACNAVEILATDDIAPTIIKQCIKYKIITHLIEVLHTDKEWVHRDAVLRALYAVMKLTPILIEIFVRTTNGIENVIKGLMADNIRQMPEYTKLQYAKVLFLLAKQRVYNKFLLDNGTVPALVNALKGHVTYDNWLCEYIVAILIILMKEKRAIIHFCRVKKSVKILSRAFIGKIYSPPVITGLMAIVFEITTNYTRSARKFLKYGFLAWLIDLREHVWPPLRKNVEATIINIIFNFLPLKFAHFGYLDYKDFTNQGGKFYATRDCFNVYTEIFKTPFPILTNKIPDDLNPRKPIYYVNLPTYLLKYDTPVLSGSEDEGDRRLLYFEDEGEAEDEELYGYGVVNPPPGPPPAPQVPPPPPVTPVTQPSSANFPPHQRSVERPEDREDDENSEEDESDISNGDYYEMETDGELEDYVDYFEDMMETSPVASFAKDSDKYITKIKYLARTVFLASCGGDPLTPVTKFMFDLHEAEIKLEFGTNIIMIGAYEYRYKFERAVLFKVLADIIGLPCWLRRDEDKNAWIELYISPNKNYDYFRSPLTANYILDLMEPDAQFYKIGSPEADEYIYNAN